MGKLQAGSGVSRAISGGSHCSRKAIRQTTASTAPAAPSRWPMPALVELTGRVGGARPGPAIDGSGFGAVVQRRAGAMGVDVVDVRRASRGRCSQASVMAASAASPRGWGWVR